MELLVATMLGQGKTVWRAEIDGQETIDFLRCNAKFARNLLRCIAAVSFCFLRFACLPHADPLMRAPHPARRFAEEIACAQPNAGAHAHNRTACRGLEGFVAAISPFNFTAIGANLATAPAIMGCAVAWKPPVTAALASYTVWRALHDAGLPPGACRGSCVWWLPARCCQFAMPCCAGLLPPCPSRSLTRARAGVINFVPAALQLFGAAVCASPHLAAINFTGSTATFKRLWRSVAANLDTYRTYPRLVGECGGKNFHLLHPSTDVAAAVAETVRAAFEYQGQKCSACSQLYVPAGSKFDPPCARSCSPPWLPSRWAHPRIRVASCPL